MKYTTERDVCKDALMIVDGACNPRAIMHSMIDMIAWLQDQCDSSGYLYGPLKENGRRVHPNNHPAIIICMSQLGVVTGTSPSGGVEGFDNAYKYCQEKVKE